MTPNIENVNPSPANNATSTDVKQLTEEKASKINSIEIPDLALPKSGGAMRGIDDKFQVNPANGTAQLSIPLPISPARNGFQPPLSLNYNSGAGNSPFGLGWNLDLPNIQIKSDKKLPQYHKGEEQLYTITGAEDLVPLLFENGAGNWEKLINTDSGITIQRYRPRVESPFQRIEKITHPVNGVYWKVTTGQNQVTFYGCSTDSRLSDPDDEQRIFRWYPEFSYDNRGNWIIYQYKKEDLSNVPNTLPEKNRLSGLAPFTNCYLKCIKYGNLQAFYPNAATPYECPSPTNSEHFFELVLDYGEHDETQPLPSNSNLWGYRSDSFSNYRTGFEIRTQRLCQRFLMFHHFQAEVSYGENLLVRSLECNYSAVNANAQGQAESSYLSEVIESGFIKKSDGTYSKKSLPSQEFFHQAHTWTTEINSIPTEQLANVPAGLSSDYRWTDLYGEGIAGILSEQEGTLWYKSHLGFSEEELLPQFATAQPVSTQPNLRGLNIGHLSIQDLEANGEKQIVVNNAPLQGFFNGKSQNESWQNFTPFTSYPKIDWRNKEWQRIDLDGDGRLELVLADDNAIVWHPSLGKEGYAKSMRISKPLDEEQGPTRLYSDGQQSIFFADMTGDGLTDVVSIKNGAVTYWANLGYGRFSAKVSMDNVPLFDHPDYFNIDQLYFTDISGTGVTDIVYLGKNKFQAFFNLSGNAWSDAQEFETLFPIHKNSSVAFIDLLGNGTNCMVWSSDLPENAGSPMRYIDLMGGKKPHLLTSYKNNLGKEVSLQYKSSTHYYLEDKKAGKDWITKLPFPVQVIAQSTVEDKISEVKFSTTYSYHHGYYDYDEKEFRGFGRVEQKDSEHYAEWNKNSAGTALEKSEVLYQQPVLTKTWFHNGAYLENDLILEHFATEYWQEEYNRKWPDAPLSITEPSLPDAVLLAGSNIQDTAALENLSAAERREALRACKGMILRQEIFALDAPEDNPTIAELQLQAKPYSVATNNCQLHLLQPRAGGEYAVFQRVESEGISIIYERDITSPRINHSLNLKFDVFGNVLEKASVIYGRPAGAAADELGNLLLNVTDFSHSTEQSKLSTAFSSHVSNALLAQTIAKIIYSQVVYTKYNDGVADHDLIDSASAYRLPVSYEQKSYEITGLTPSDTLYRPEDFADVMTSGAVEINYEAIASSGVERRLIEHQFSLFYNDDLTAVLDKGYMESQGIPYESYQLAFTPDLVNDIYIDKNGIALQANGSTVESILSSQGKYELIDNNYWIRSGIIHYLDSDFAETINEAKERFYSPVQYEDALSAYSALTYDVETFATSGASNNDGYYLFIKSVVDEMANEVNIDEFNYRTLSPNRILDANANPSSVIQDELGLVKAQILEGNGYYDSAGVFQLEAADSATGLSEESTLADQTAIANLLAASTTAELKTQAALLLGRASSRIIYDFDAYQNDGQPSFVASISREEHFSQNPNSELQIHFSYSDGMGNVILTKMPTDPGEAFYMDGAIKRSLDTSPNLRWIGNGRTILNNKGKAVKQFEPYFSTNFKFENNPELVEIGVTPILYYDAMGRNTLTEYPNGTLSKVEFSPWQQKHYDQNDTVLESSWYDDRINRNIDTELSDAGLDPAEEESTASKTAAHDGTPTIVIMDALGRSVLSIAHNGLDTAGKEISHATYVELDIEGNALSVQDARGNTPMRYRYDILGQRIHQHSNEAGRRWTLQDVMGNPINSWDDRGHVHHFTYDAIHRLTTSQITGGPNSLNNIYQKLVYGEGQTDDQKNNLRLQTYEVYDTAGRITNLEFDFKGSVLESERMFATDYKSVVNWTGNLAILLDTTLGTFSSIQEYDALGRMKKATSPDNSEVEYNYNPGNQLQEILLTQSGVAQKAYIEEIKYNEKGQRKSVAFGNGITTNYKYDPLTFRLIHLESKKNSGDQLQDLYYSYDPVGNIACLQDKSIPAQFFSGTRIEGKSEYTFDPLYKLIAATGREHAGQQINFTSTDNYQDLPFLKSYASNDAMAWRNYTQNYDYDPVGNLLTMNHSVSGAGGAAHSWTRQNSYQSGNNQLTQTQIGGHSFSIAHDADHGFINALPHLSVMQWNFNDELVATSKQVVSSGIPETTYYVYDGSGQRVRKITENQGGASVKEQRLYLGDLEIYKKESGSNSGLKRNSLHLSDDQGRLAMIDTRNSVNDGSQQRTVRYQFSNHLGSAALEVDDHAAVISYEEYHPYGSTAYQATSNSIQVAAKRYRYTGMERDEETGMNYHGARYYLSWLGRWLSADPIGLEGGINGYIYSACNPIVFIDPGGTKEYESLADYTQQTGNTSLGKYDWLESDREGNSQVWKDAMTNITKDKVPGQLAPFEQVRDYYLWVQQELDKKGHEIRWIQGAVMLVDDLADSFDEGVTTANWGVPFTNTRFSSMDVTTVQLLRDLNVGIADYGITQFHELLFGQYAHTPLTGDAAMQFDIDFIIAEQGTIAKPIYQNAGVNSTAMTEMNQMARKEGYIGNLLWLAGGGYIPSFSDYGISLLDPTYGRDARIEVPLLMLYPDRYKPTMTPGLVSQTDAQGYLTGDALGDFQAAYQGSAARMRWLGLRPGPIIGLDGSISYVYRGRAIR